MGEFPIALQIVDQNLCPGIKVPHSMVPAHLSSLTSYHSLSSCHKHLANAGLHWLLLWLQAFCYFRVCAHRWLSAWNNHPITTLIPFTLIHQVSVCHYVEEDFQNSWTGSRAHSLCHHKSLFLDFRGCLGYVPLQRRCSFAGWTSSKHVQKLKENWMTFTGVKMHWTGLMCWRG